MKKYPKYPYIQIILCLLFWIPVAVNAMTCYTIFNKSEKVIFQSASAPVDMSETVISPAVQSKFGADAFMIFSENQVCAEITAPIEEVPSKITAPVSTPATISAPAVTPNTSGTFKCDGRKYCSQMTSCAEATFFLKNCRATKMDGDGDGIPCEQQWCKNPQHP